MSVSLSEKLNEEVGSADLDNAADDLVRKFQLEMEASLEKVAQLQGFIAGMNKAINLVSEYKEQQKSK